MIFLNASYLDEQFRLVKGAIEIDQGKIKRIGEQLSYTPQDMVVDCEGFTIVPGFVDVHIHGCVGHDTCDGSREDIDAMARFLITKGVTSFCPTTMTVDKETIEKALLAAKACVDTPLEDGARVVGVNMEGPFISAQRKGAQREDAISPPDFELFQHFYQLSGKIVRMVDVAPERPGGMDFVKQASALCTVSIAHTTADYDLAKAAFDCGITHATHLYNAMNGLTHRAPGVVGAVFDDDRVQGELICDGFHIHPAVLRTSFRLLGDRVVVVSDAMRGSGMEDGMELDLGGQMVTVKNGTATLADGTIAGSVTNLHQELQNLVSFGIPLEDAVRACTLSPAKAIGLDHEIGSIQVGKRADLVVLDSNLDIVGVYH